MKSIDEMSKSELEAEQVIKELEFQEATANLATVETRDNELATKIDELRLERRKLGNSLIQGKANIRRVNSELRNIKTMIYQRLAGL
jgi:chromosome segregation ATPase